MKALTFHTTKFDITDRNGQPWLRGFQIGSALGYKNPSADMAKLYDRNADEFTASMTALVELDTAGGKQQVRIFSLRGVHLLAMLSRTKVAKEFRHWVLDVLDAQIEAQAKSGGLTPAQQHHIQNRVRELASAPGNCFAAVYRSIKDAFKVGTYKDIAAEQYPALCQFLLCKPLEGELLEAERLEAQQAKALELNYPARLLLELNPHLRSAFGADRLSLRANDLCGMDARSPTLKLLGELTRAGHDVEACRLEVLTMRHHLEAHTSLTRTLQRLADNSLAAALTVRLS